MSFNVDQCSSGSDLRQGLQCTLYEQAFALCKANNNNCLVYMYLYVSALAIVYAYKRSA